MQEQINAIKQLIEINNMTESQIDGILIKALGLQASWENCSVICELSDFEDQFCEEEISNEIRWIMELLWRSRIDLNDAKHHAEIAGLEEFLSETFFKDTAEDLINEKVHNENLIKELQLAVNNDNKSQTIQSLQIQIKGYQALCEGYLETQQERDREIESLQTNKSRFLELESLLETRNAEIENLKLALDAANKPTDDLQMECDQLRRDLRERDRALSVLDTEVDSLRLDVKERDQHVSSLKAQIMDFRSNLKADCADIIDQCKEDDIKDRQIEELQITVKKNREQFDSLKSHFEVLLKAIAMNLNALKGERKPDRVEEVDGVKVKYREYGDNLTHHQKTLIIEHLQRAIAEEAKKLKGANLKDFSFDDIPF